MDIYLTEISSGDRLRIPLLPDRLNIRTGAVATTLNIIKAGEARIPRGTIATGYSWNGVFPSEALENSPFVYDWQEPSRILSTIREWQERNSPIRLLITDLSINADVFIESFTGEYYGIGDFSYSISLTTLRSLTVTTVAAPPVPVVPPEEEPPAEAEKPKQYGQVKTNGSRLNIRKKTSTSSSIIGKLQNGAKVEILGKTGNWYIIPYASGTNGKGYIYASWVKLIASAPTTTSKTTTSTAKKTDTSSTRTKKNTTRTYTVKSGDTLYSIAKATLGDGTRYMEIYNLNKAAIDSANSGSTASKCNVWAGMTLKLPEATNTQATKTASNSAKGTTSSGKEITTVLQKLVTTTPSSSLINAVKTAVLKTLASKTTTKSGGK